jgi:TonB-linked SusC/RagA family outer membrane protein
LFFSPTDHPLPDKFLIGTHLTKYRQATATTPINHIDGNPFYSHHCFCYQLARFCYSSTINNIIFVSSKFYKNNLNTMKTKKMMMRGIFLTIVLFLLSCLPLLSQNFKAEGVVTDSNGETLPGVTVKVKDSAIGTITDVNGKYNISISKIAHPVLIFSYVGYDPIEIKISQAKQSKNVVLNTSNKQLNEVVVVGYGTQKKATLSGSVSTVSGKEILKSPAMNVTNSLGGTIPGLVAVGQSGEPGNDKATLYIRGTGTWKDSSPLIVVDGVPDRSLERIDPSTIENISILKDASAAIYGARAANGVILVTTKRGKSEKMKISANYTAGWSRPTKVPNVCDAAEYATLCNEVCTYNNKTQAFTAEAIQKYADGSDPWRYPNTDWYKEVMKNWSMQHNANVSMSGGNDNVQAFVSLSSRYQDGYFKNSGSNYAQQDLKANIIGKINKYISLDVDFTGSMQKANFLPVTSATLFYELQSADPTKPARWPNGLPGPPLGLVTQHNPVVQSTSEAGYDRNESYTFNLTGKLTVKLPWVEGLTWTTTGALDRSLYYTKKLNKKYVLYTWDGSTVDGNNIPVLESAWYGGSSSLYQYFKIAKEYTVFSHLNYQRTFNKVHEVSVLAGIEAIENGSNYFTGERDDNTTGFLEELNFGNSNYQYATGAATGNDRWQNYFGRVNYAYAQKYMLEFVWRYQGSSKFNTGYRYGFFPGVSAAYRLSEENFWKNSPINKIINSLKIRGSWGKTGNDKIDSYQYLSLYSLSSQNFVNGSGTNEAAYYESLAGNKYVHWEEARQFDVGFDISLLNSRLNLTADYFNSFRTKILAERTESVADFTGLSDILPEENMGKTRNQGFDFELSWSDKIKDFSYRIGLNGGYAKSKVVFNDEASNVPDYQKITGHPWGTSLYYDAIGIFHNQAEIDNYPKMSGVTYVPGDIKFRDVNGDGKIDGTDKTRINKNGVPTWTGGLSLSAGYKGFDLSMLFQGQAGAVRYVQQTGGYMSQRTNYLQSFYNKRWTAANPNADYPRTFDRNNEYWVSSDNPNTFWLHKTDFIRLKNIEIGYTIPATITKKLACETIRIKISGMNLLTYAPDMEDYDPELSFNGDGFPGEAYPIQKMITTGISVNF